MGIVEDDSSERKCNETFMLSSLGVSHFWRSSGSKNMPIYHIRNATNGPFGPVASCLSFSIMWMFMGFASTGLGLAILVDGV
jgi:hypothetical protein